MYKISIATLFRVFLILYVVFMMSTLKFTLGLASISWIFNGSVFAIAILVIFYGLAYSKFSLLPSASLIVIFFLIFSSLLNLFVNWSPLGLLQVSTYLLPWLAFIMVLSNQEVISRSYKSYWVWANNLFVFLCLVGLCEYLAIYALGYRPPIMELNTGMGEYYVGYFTLLQKIPDLDIPYFRFQGPFTESGDLAMWASVFFVYNLLRRQYSFAIILAVAIFGSFSPSIFISFFVAFFAYILTRSVFIMPILFIIASLAIVIFMSDIILLYNNILEMKEGSLYDRMTSTLDFFSKLPYLLNNYPLGIPFFETTNEKVASGLGFTASYGFIRSYEVGGLIAFLVYILLTFYGVLVSGQKILFSRTIFIENEIYIYYLMLFTYVVQRATLLDYAITPFLFAAVFLRTNKYEKKEYKLLTS